MNPAHAVRTVHPACHWRREQIRAERVVFAVLHQKADGFIVNVDGPDGVPCFWIRHPKLSFPPWQRILKPSGISP